MKQVTIHTDGGCVGNPGPGGWGAVMQYGEHRKEISGGDPATTNNRMELSAAIEALRALKEPCAVEMFTDSQYLRQGITEWVPMWKKRGWRTMSKSPVKNRELWIELDRQAGRHQIHWHWLKGHAGHKENERCDTLAQKQISKIRKTHSRAQLKQLLHAFREASQPAAHAQSTLSPPPAVLQAPYNPPSAL